MTTQRKSKQAKVPEPLYLCLYKDGYLDCAAQIYERHSDTLITVEYLPYFSMMVWVSAGIRPALDPVDVEATETLNLDEIKETYKFHYSWVTVARDFAKSEKYHEKTGG